jgi:hypothetical protein
MPSVTTWTLCEAGAVESTPLRVHAPQACASANSATTANIELVQTSSHAYLKLMRLPIAARPSRTHARRQRRVCKVCSTPGDFRAFSSPT